MDTVRTLFRKYDGTPHRLMDTAVLGEDEHGLWVGSRPGDRAQRADGTWTAVDHHRVRLFPRGQWWSALFNDEPHPTRIYCDITLPAEFGAGTVTTVDLDLDVRLYRDGRIQVMDEDEFETHRHHYAYPPQVVATARATCTWITANLPTTEPFLTTYRTYLALIRGEAGTSSSVAAQR